MLPARGLTLIEVMIALAIVMILTTLAYPSYAGYITKTRRIEGMMALVETMQHQERYFMSNNRYLAFSAAAPDPDAPQFHAWSGSSAARSAYQIDGQACPGQAITDCVELHATPGAATVDSTFKDLECGMLILDSAGRRSAGGPAANCWP